MLNDACDAVKNAQREFEKAKAECVTAQQLFMVAQETRRIAEESLKAEQQKLLQLLEMEAVAHEYAPPDSYSPHIKARREAEQNVSRLQSEAREAIARARAAKELIDGRKIYLDEEVLDA